MQQLAEGEVDEEELGEEGVDEESLQDKLRACLEVLDAREKWIVQAYFGLENLERRTLEQIGNEMGLTRERVRQLRNRALNKMRVECGEVAASLA